LELYDSFDDQSDDGHVFAGASLELEEFLVTFAFINARSGRGIVYGETDVFTTSSWSVRDGNVC